MGSSSSRSEENLAGLLEHVRTALKEGAGWKGRHAEQSAEQAQLEAELLSLHAELKGRHAEQPDDRTQLEADVRSLQAQLKGLRSDLSQDREPLRVKSSELMDKLRQLVPARLAPENPVADGKDAEATGGMSKLSTDAAHEKQATAERKKQLLERATEYLAEGLQEHFPDIWPGEEAISSFPSSLPPLREKRQALDKWTPPELPKERQDLRLEPCPSPCASPAEIEPHPVTATSRRAALGEVQQIIDSYTPDFEDLSDTTPSGSPATELRGEEDGLMLGRVLNLLERHGDAQLPMELSEQERRGRLLGWSEEQAAGH